MVGDLSNWVKGIFVSVGRNDTQRERMITAINAIIFPEHLDLMDMITYTGGNMLDNPTLSVASCSSRRRV